MRRVRVRTADMLRMEDVAAHAGVSTMTVSRALRDGESVSQATRDRVLAAVRHTGYVPNRLAGSLSSQRSYGVGLVVPGISNSLYASSAQSISAVLRQHGMHLLIADSGHDPVAEEEAIGAFLAQRVCGLILHNTRHTARARVMIQAARVPVVEIGRLTRAPLDMCISYSGSAAAKAMVLHLGGLGYRRIGFVSLALRGNDRAEERRRGYLAGLKALGLPVPDHAVLEAQPGLQGGAEAVGHIVRHNAAVDAIFFAADVMAVGALFECQRQGWPVPQRLAIASFDNVELLSHVVPTITTLSIPRAEIGRRSATMLVERLKGAAEGPSIIDMGFGIITRESTVRAAPRQSAEQKDATIRQRSRTI